MGGQKPQQALHLLQELRFRGLLPDVITYSAAVSACEKGQKPQQALHLLQELPFRGLLPDMITYNAAILACGKGQTPQQRCTWCKRCRSEACDRNLASTA